MSYPLEEYLTIKAQRKDLFQKLETNIQDMFEPQRYISHLRTMATFPQDRVMNTLLINLQNQQATLIAERDRWLDRGRSIVLGSQSIKILIPMPYNKCVIKLFDDKGEPLKGPILKTIPLVDLYPVEMFDISQTQGRALIKEYRFMPAEEREAAQKTIHEQAYSGAVGTEAKLKAASTEYVACARLNLSSDPHLFEEAYEWGRGKSNKELMKLLVEVKQHADAIVIPLESKLLKAPKPALLQRPNKMWDEIMSDIAKKPPKASIADDLQKFQKICAERDAATPKASRRSKDFDIKR